MASLEMCDRTKKIEIGAMGTKNKEVSAMALEAERASSRLWLRRYNVSWKSGRPEDVPG